jgi:hypothetical protein
MHVHGYPRKCDQHLHHLEPIAQLYLIFLNCSDRELDYALDLEVYTGYKTRAEPWPHFHDFHLSVEGDYIDRKQHPKSMNAGRGPDKKSTSGVQPTFSY